MGNDGTHPCHPSRSPSLLHVLVVEICSHLVDIELSGSSSSLSKELWAHLDATSLPYEEDVEFSVTGSNNRPTNTVPASCIGGALHMAVSYSLVEIALALIRSGADSNDHCKVVGSPLVVATGLVNHRARMVKVLLENGARPDGNCTSQCIHRSDYLGTPLYHLVHVGDVESVHLLLRFGADPDVKDSSESTPLQKAIQYGYPDIVRALLERKADANAVFPNCDPGCNPLTFATMSDMRYGSRSHARLDMIELLLKHGATINARCELCKTTALDHALRSSDRRLVKALRNAGAR
jgi:ankyrin repeat protein